MQYSLQDDRVGPQTLHKSTVSVPYYIFVVSHMIIPSFSHTTDTVTPTFRS